MLSRLLFGTSITNLSAPEALQLAAAVASLNNSGGGLDPINAVRAATGLDRLRIVPADITTGQGTAIAAGKYLGRRVYVEVVTDARGYSATPRRISDHPLALAAVEHLDHRPGEREREGVEGLLRRRFPSNSILCLQVARAEWQQFVNALGPMSMLSPTWGWGSEMSSDEYDGLAGARQSQRLPLEAETRLRPNSWSSLQIRMLDLSTSGFRAECEARVQPGSRVSLDIPGIGAIDAQIAWQRGDRIGARFFTSIELARCQWALRERQPTLARLLVERAGRSRPGEAARKSV